MKISEIFYSIQGEGSLLGVPSVFVRTTGCNLRCVWCDTPYTSWQPEGEEMAISDILRKVQSYNARHAVVTGGEPLIMPAVPELIEQLRSLGFHVTIETAGTVSTTAVCDLMSISPKLGNSTPEGAFAQQHDKLRLNMQVLKELMQQPYQLKFVVAAESDMAEILALVRALGAPPESVMLMPEGTKPELLRERSGWLVEQAKLHGYRFTPRLHIDLYGNRRGV